MSKKKPITLDDVRRWEREATEAWLEENADRETVNRSVRRALDARREELVAKLMGFDRRWGSDWEVDHCNGRAGESAAGDFLRSLAVEGVKEWLSEQAGNMPDLPKKAVQALRMEYRDILHDEVRERIAMRAVEKSRQAVERILSEEAGRDLAD